MVLEKKINDAEKKINSDKKTAYTGAVRQAVPDKTNPVKRETVTFEIDLEVLTLLEDEFYVKGFKEYRIVDGNRLLTYVDHTEYIQVCADKISNEKKKAREEKRKKDKRYLGRDKQIKGRFTDEEYENVKKKWQAAGKKPGDFVREMLLEGQVKSFPSHAADIELIEDVRRIKTDTGKMSGMMMLIVKVAKEKGQLDDKSIELLREIARTYKAHSKDIKKMLDSGFK